MMQIPQAENQKLAKSLAYKSLKDKLLGDHHRGKTEAIEPEKEEERSE